MGKTADFSSTFSSTMDWNLDFRSELYKEEFFRTDAWRDVKQRHRMIGGWTKSTRTEVEELRELQRSDRTSHLGRILREQQSGVLLGYWYDCLKFDPKKNPHTDELLHATLHLAGSVAMYFKNRFGRVRPWVIEPALSPPLLVLPRHPAYPGGHATQIHLMAITLRDLISGQELPSETQETGAEAAMRIDEIAAEVSKDRERAGLHYESDTVAGTELAQRVFEILSDKCHLFQETVRMARAEMSQALVNLAQARAIAPVSDMCTDWDDMTDPRRRQP